MSKLIYSKSLNAFKLAFPNYSQENDASYRSVVYTADGYIITHGKIMKAGIVTDESNPYNLEYTLNGQRSTIGIDGVYKSIDLPVIDVETSTNDILNTTITNGVVDISHVKGNAAWTGNQSVGPTSNSSISIVVPNITFDKYGHYKSVVNRTATLNKVRQVLSTSSDVKYLLFSNAQNTGTTDGYTAYNTNIKAVASTGTLYATKFNEGGNLLQDIYAPIVHTSTSNTYGLGSSSLYGHVKLSDSISSNSSVNSGVASTPKAVMDSLIAAKSYADSLISSNDAMILVGTLNASTGVIVSVRTNIGSKHNIVAGTTKITDLTDYSAGWTFRVAVAGTIAGIGVLEVDDVVMSINDAGSAYSANDWTAIQTNINGAITSVDTLSPNTLIIGNGSKTVKSLANGSNNTVLKIVNGIPTWSTHYTNREIQINGTTLLNANTATPFNIIAGSNITITPNINNGTATISAKDTTYTAGTGLSLSGTQFSLKKATSSELGGVMIGYSSTGKNYAVLLDSNNKMYVNVPWLDTNTTYNVANYQALGLMKPFKSHTAAATGITPSTDSTAIAVSAISTNAGRYYAVELDNQGHAFVNVPWSNTHYTTALHVGAKDAKSNSVTTNGNTYIKLFDDSSLRNQFNIKGTGATIVTTDGSGNIVISSDNTWRNVTSYKPGATLSKSTIGSKPLSFSDSFGFEDDEIDLMWAEIDSAGTITYVI